MWCRPAADRVPGPRGVEGVQRLADRPVPDGMHMHPEARDVEPGYLLGQVGRIHIGEPAVPGLAAAAIQVGVDHPGGEVLRDAILHDLHGAGPEPAHLALLPPVEQVVQLVCAAAAIPPQGALDPGGERAVPRGGQVGRQRVRKVQVLPHDRVLPGGDAQRVQVLLGQQQPAELLGEGRAGHEPAHQQCRGLVQGALRLIVRPALDPAVPGVGGGGGQARQVQGPGIGPGAVAVPVGQVGRPVRDHAVQQFPRGGAAGEPLHPPAAAVDPLPVRMGLRVGPDPGQRAVQVLRAVQVAALHGDPGEGRVHVGVLEPGQQGPAAQGDRLRLTAGQVADLVVAADRDDPATAHCHRGRGRPVRGPDARPVAGVLAAGRLAVGRGRDHAALVGKHGVDPPAGEDQVCCHARHPISTGADQAGGGRVTAAGTSRLSPAARRGSRWRRTTHRTLLAGQAAPCGMRSSRQYRIMALAIPGAWA